MASEASDATSDSQQSICLAPNCLAPICLAIDAMGGDFAPAEIVKGAIIGARTHGVKILLVGKPEAIQAELNQHDHTGLPIEIVPASEVIEMGESTGTAVRRKRDASIVVTAKCVANGQAHGMIAAGSTGAAMASALLNIGRLEGIDRPAIGVMMPSINPKRPCLLVDAGANADCLPEMLVQFARMGNVFMHNVYELPKPQVGLLNIGEEAGKGNTFVNSAFKLLSDDPTLNFVGNIEGRDIFAGTVDVAVCDGFTGNVALKVAEGVSVMMNRMIKEELKKSLPSLVGGLLAKSGFTRIKKRVDPEEFGGALLLGIRGICVIAHGKSSAFAIQNAIRVAKEAVEKQVLHKMSQQFEEKTAQHQDQHNEGTVSL